MLNVTQHAWNRIQQRGVSIPLDQIERWVSSSQPTGPGDNGNLVFEMNYGGRIAKVVTDASRSILVTVFWKD